MSIASATKTAWGRFLGFWFTPADPTAMAFLRIITGCLVLYTHLVYSFDLTAFFGRTAWYDLETVNQVRWEEPGRFPPLGWEHEQVTPSAAFPDTEGARRVVFDWVRSLPADSAELAAKLRLVDTAGVLNGGKAPRYSEPLLVAALNYALKLEPDPVLRQTELRFLAGERPPNEQPRQSLNGLDTLSVDERKQLAVDLEAFYSTLPQPPGRDVDEVREGERDRRVVVAYLAGLGHTLRGNLLAFLRDSTTDKVPEFERKRRIDYLERWGFEERFVHRSGSPVFSVWFHITEPTEMAVTHACILLVMLLFTLGLFTRVTSVLTWLGAASYLHRDAQVLFGQDTMMNILLIYLMIANSGAALSLDRVIARYRAVRGSLARTGGIDARTAEFLNVPPPSIASGFAQRMLQVHFCFIYMAAGLSKLKGASWWSGDAMWYTLVNPEFTMIHFEWYRSLVQWVFSSRPAYSAVAAGGVLFTLFVEIGLPFLVWTRLRPYIVVGGYLLHFGVGVFMGLLVFSLFMMTMLSSYLPGSVIREQLFGRGNGNGGKKKVPVNPSDPKSCHAAALALALDTRGKVEVVPQK